MKTGISVDIEPCRILLIAQPAQVLSLFKLFLFIPERVCLDFYKQCKRYPVMQAGFPQVNG